LYVDGRQQHNHNIERIYHIVLPKWKRNPAKEANDRLTPSCRDGLQRDSTGFGSMKTFVSKQDRLGTFIFGEKLQHLSKMFPLVELEDVEELARLTR